MLCFVVFVLDMKPPRDAIDLPFMLGGQMGLAVHITSYYLITSLIYNVSPLFGLVW